MPIDDRTANRNYKLPNAGNFLADDVVRLRDALTAIDADVFARYTKTETDQKLADLINGAPGALDTLNELAAAMGNDPNFATTITNALAGKPGFADVWTRTQADARYVQGINQTENVFTGTGSQTTFALSQTPPSRESLLVTVDGVVQPTSEYNLSGSALILSEAPASGAKIRVLMLGVAGPVQSASTLNFAQDGVGAVTRTVESKLREFVSPLDYGAAGNNITNDTTPVSAARTAAPNSAINLSGKSYLVTSIPAGWPFFNGLLTLNPAATDDQPANEAYGYGALAANAYIPKQHSSSTLTWASGNFNAAFGSYALGSNTTGRRQTAIGALALQSNTSGYYNTAVGAWSLYSNVIGNYNTAVGTQALQYCTGNSNTAVGSGALTLNTNGTDNIAIGDSALGSSPALNRSIAIGKQAGWFHTGDDSIAIGHQTLSASTSSGLYNIAIGSVAGSSLTTGNSNVAIGRRALASSSTGSGNVAVGTNSMVSAGNGSNNTAVGDSTLGSNTSGYQNVAIGKQALSANTTGFSNTGVGRSSLSGCTTGAGNAALGEQALVSLTTADYCSALGKSALSGNTTFSNCSGVGYNAQVTGADQVQLGDLFTTTYAYGAVQNRSDQRDKADIRDSILGLDFINSLRPVDFRWDYREAYANPNEKDGSKKRPRYHHGLIAQEVKAACDAAGVDFGGYQDHSVNGGQDVLSLGYGELIAPLIKAVQQLSAEVEQLKSQLPSSAT